jgi:hypothetical protein
MRKKMRKTRGMMLLLMQYFRKGNWVAARKVKWRLKTIKVVMFQLMINTPIDMPIMAVLKEFTSPRYSGARKSASAPKLFISTPLMAAKRTIQKMSSTWYFLK